jgi:hypothetical protein
MDFELGSNDFSSMAVEHDRCLYWQRFELVIAGDHSSITKKAGQGLL